MLQPSNGTTFGDSVPSRSTVQVLAICSTSSASQRIITSEQDCRSYEQLKCEYVLHQIDA